MYTRAMGVLAAAIVCGVGVVSAAVSSQPAAMRTIAFPADAGMLSVRDFGAKGDGVADDTKALQAALNKARGHMMTAYLPAGTYLVSDTVGIPWEPWTFVQGAKSDKTVIRLADRCTGFGDAGKAKAVFTTQTPFLLPDQDAKNQGGSNMNFSAHVMDLTIDTGKGNPGAIGIHYISHNGGGLENVIVRSGDGAGVIGVDMRRKWPGPALCKNLTVQGFDVGIECWHATYSDVFEHITLEKQRVAGWRNNGHPISIRDLTSRNSVPAVQNTGGDGQVVLIDSDLSGGASGAAAIENKGGLFIRNVKVSGYGTAIKDGGKTVPGPLVAEYVTGEAQHLAPSRLAGLNLPVKETPDLPWGDTAKWVNVMKYNPPKVSIPQHPKPTEGYDATEALQKAVDTGADTVYLPHGNYYVRDTIRLPPTLRVLQGCGSILYGDLGTVFLKGKPLLSVEGKADGPLFIDRLSTSKTWELKFDKEYHAADTVFLEHSSPRIVVVQHSRWVNYHSKPGAGDAYFEDLCAAPLTLDARQNVWIRQLNCETGDKPKVVNNAATLWILGYKAEGQATNVINGEAAATELLGGTVYPAGGDVRKYPAFINKGGRLSLTHTMFWANATYIIETRGGVEKKLDVKPGTRFMPLYVSNPE